MGKKGTKKINRRIKRSVRKTVGVLTLIMAIIVAAIPTPSARAVGGEENASSVPAPEYKVAQPTYDANGHVTTPGADDAKITNITPNVSGDTKDYHSQKIYQIDGKYYLYTVFDYFMYKGPTDSAASGCIKKYYDSYTGKLVDGELIIPGTVTASYLTFTQKAVVDFFKNNTTTLTDDELKRYYPSEWAAWEAWDEYTKLTQEEKDKIDAAGKTPPTATKPVHTAQEFLDTNAANPWLDPAKEGRRYFCSHHPDLRASITAIGDGDEYILYEVTDMNALTGSGTETIYIPVRVGSEIEANRDYSDQFFVPSNKEIPIGYIADEAFQNATFKKLTIPQGVIQIIGNEAFVGSSIEEVSAWSGVIGNRAFKGCTNLKSITLNTRQIGTECFYGCNSLTSIKFPADVEEIGAGAFANCKKLQNVIFSTPSGGYQNFKIGSSAFSTGGDTLTFYGDIVEGYAPFEWAMGADNYMNREKKMRVCYRSGTLEHPNLTVLYDNATDAVTLVDYPHYDGLDWSNDPDLTYGTIRERYEKRLSGAYNDEREVALDEEEYACLMNVLNIVIPAGVDSIDVKKFIESSTENGNNTRAYIQTSPYYPDESQNPYYLTYRQSGLFNGYYGELDGGTDDDGREIKYEYNEADREKYEQNPIGNDRIQTVTMNTVTYLPDRAFESCENLQAVSLGSALEDIGTAPFTGCTNLTGVSGNQNYPCENGIIYKTNDTGLTIVECLPARGNFVGAPNFPDRDDTNFSKVTQINEGAFENCTAITVVDLSAATKLTRIPRSCFKGAESLYDVKLPESVDDIREESFATGNKTLSVTIPAIEVDIADNAFDDVNTVTLRSYENSAVENYVDRKGSRFHFEPINRKYSVQFLDYNGDVIPYVDKDGTKIYIQYVEHGYPAKQPEDPSGGPAGYVFDKWNRDFQEVTSDLVITALYKWGYPNTSPGVLPNTSPGANKNTPTPAPNGTPTPGAGTPGAGTPGAGTPGAGTPGAGTPGASNNNQNNQRYRLTVENGSGSGTYVAGTSVVITANTPPSGQRFERWTSIANDYNITSATSSITTITMPSHDMTIVANYTSGSGTSNGNNGSGNNNNSTNTNINGNGNSGGTTVDITKPGISDTGVANATVEGSTDNFVVKITDTAEARAAVEAALINEYGTLDNLRYFAMDISLYDSTGTVKIEDTSNLAVNITMPIPDELRLYAGNNQVAGVVNGNVLDKLSPRFTTINGVPCISFTATHFSPYTVYVDTSNLSAGVSDSTPKTGDLIHPKWFLAVALACVSMILLLKKDKKQPNVKAA